MNIIGRHVHHFKFGSGEIAEQAKNGDIFILFEGSPEKRRFQYPKAFEKYLSTDDSELNDEIKKLFTMAKLAGEDVDLTYAKILESERRAAQKQREQEEAEARARAAQWEKELGIGINASEAAQQQDEEASDAQTNPAVDVQGGESPAETAKAEEPPTENVDAAETAKTAGKEAEAHAPSDAVAAEQPKSAASNAQVTVAPTGKPAVTQEAKPVAVAGSGPAPAATPPLPAGTETPAPSVAAPQAEKAEPVKEAVAVPAVAPSASAPAENADTTKKASKSDYKPPQRTPGVPLTYFVFQGKTFKAGLDGGYIWAPYSFVNGLHQTSWDILQYVEPGDIIIHGEDAKIKAISRAEGACYEAEKPPEFEAKVKFSALGRKINTKYIPLDVMLPTKFFLADILRLAAPRKHAPFNTQGNGNQGYLYDLDPELARIFIRGAINANPKLRDVDFIRTFLEMEQPEDTAEAAES